MKLNFKADKHTVTEGDIVELSWNAPECDSLTLTLDNGFKSQTLPIDNHTGSKKFRLHRSQGRTRLTLSATHNGKTSSQTIKVRVKKMKVTRAETLYEERRHRNPFHRNKQPNGKLGAWLHNQRNRFSYNWNLLTPKKQMAYTLLGIMTIGLLFSLISPSLTYLTNTAILIYLAFVLLKK